MRLKVSSAKRRPFCLGLNEIKGPLVSTKSALKLCANLIIESQVALGTVDSLILVASPTVTLHRSWQVRSVKTPVCSQLLQPLAIVVTIQVLQLSKSF